MDEVRIQSAEGIRVLTEAEAAEFEADRPVPAAVVVPKKSLEEIEAELVALTTALAALKGA